MLTLVPEEIERYVAEHSEPLPPLMQELVAETKEVMGKRSVMLSGQIEGALLQTLIASLGATRVLEVGMFTGFSALMMAAALPGDGKLITCEINDQAISLAERYFARSPHGAKIDIRRGPAIDTLRALKPPFDLVFIDADKTNYTAYYEASLDLLAPKGVIVVDNVLWSGDVLDPKDDDGKAIVAFNQHVQDDDRVTNVILTVRDGISLIRRR
ncbi:MAG: class I SAM-dependent methyltransferase [Chloroflexi bacterium]|nr:class I SAM-dependent methyltransferase [Chloroflexota bacterium]